MNVRDAAQRIGRDPSTIRKWIRTGKIQADRLEDTHGAKYDIPDEEVMRLAEREQPPTLIETGVSAAGIFIPREMVIEAIKQAIKETMFDVTKSFQDYIQLQQATFAELDALKSLLAQTYQEVACTKGLVSAMDDEQRKERDKQLVGVFNQLKELKRTNKHGWRK